MFHPYVVGQSGTLRPDAVLVTSPPTKIKKAVKHAVKRANRWSAMLSWVMGDSIRGRGAKGSDPSSPKGGTRGLTPGPFLRISLIRRAFVVGAEAEVHFLL